MPQDETKDEQSVPASEPHELLGAYVIGALDDSERMAVERWLATSPEGRAELAKLNEAAAAVGASTPAEPPGEVWNRIGRDIGSERPSAELQPAGPPSSHMGGSWALTIAAATVALVLGTAAVVQTVRIGGLNDTVADQDRRLGTAATELATRQVQLGALNDTVTVSGQRADALAAAVAERDEMIAALQSQLADPLQAAAERAASDPRSLQVSLAAPEAGTPHLTAVIQEDGRGYITNFSLAPLPPELTYQLWAILDDGRVVSVAVLGNNPGLSGFTVDVDSLAALAVTAEGEGGVAVSGNDPVAFGAVGT